MVYFSFVHLFGFESPVPYCHAVCIPEIYSFLLFVVQIQRKFIKETMAKADGHSDTSFSAGSLKAARRAAGAVQHAVDW